MAGSDRSSRRPKRRGGPRIGAQSDARPDAVGSTPPPADAGPDGPRGERAGAEAPGTPPGTSRGRGWFVQGLLAALLVLLGVIAYADRGGPEFILDGYLLIARSLDLLAFTDDAIAGGRSTLERIRAALEGEPRPLTELTFALDVARFGLDARPFRTVNLLIHLAAGLVLMDLVRRLLRSPGAPAFAAGVAAPLAFAAAALWMLHPLQTQSVAYVIQRSESLMGLLYLATLDCWVIGAGRRRAWPWITASIACFVLGLGAKEVIVTAPIAVLLIDRTFLAGSARAAIARRRGGYAVFAVLLVVGILAISRSLLGAEQAVDPLGRGPTVGFGVGVSPWSYLLTQAGVIAWYLRLAIWPSPLVLDYGWPIAGGLGDAVVPGLLVLGLLGLALWLLWKRPAAGLALAWFFLVLAPTSSIVPIQDPIFEHRVYLALAGPAALVAVVGWWLCRRLLPARPIGPALGPGGLRPTLAGLAATAALGVMLTGLLVTTAGRLDAYASRSTMWRDVIAKRPENARAHHNLAVILKEIAEAGVDPATGASLDVQARLALHREALEAFRAAVRLQPQQWSHQVGLAEQAAMLAQADGSLDADEPLLAEAFEAFEAAAGIRPASINIVVNHGVLLSRLARDFRDRGQSGPERAYRDRAIERFRAAIEGGDPDLTPMAWARAQYNLGTELYRERDFAGTEAAYRRAVEVRPDYATAWYGLALVYQVQGRRELQVEAAEAALRADPDHAGARRMLGR